MEVLSPEFLWMKRATEGSGVIQWAQVFTPVNTTRITPLPHRFLRFGFMAIVHHILKIHVTVWLA